jgi:hypothetical protein
MCQALAILPANKYENGPGVSAIVELDRQH